MDLRFPDRAILALVVIVCFTLLLRGGWWYSGQLSTAISLAEKATATEAQTAIRGRTAGISPDRKVKRIETRRCLESVSSRTQARYDSHTTFFSRGLSWSAWGSCNPHCMECGRSRRFLLAASECAMWGGDPEI